METSKLAPSSFRKWHANGNSLKSRALQLSKNRTWMSLTFGPPSQTKVLGVMVECYEVARNISYLCRIICFAPRDPRQPIPENTIRRNDRIGYIRLGRISFLFPIAGQIPKLDVASSSPVSRSIFSYT